MFKRLREYFRRILKLDNEETITRPVTEEKTIKQEKKHPTVNLERAKDRVESYDKGGDIYWVKMNKKDFKGPGKYEDHNVRPFVIVKEREKEYYGYYTSSNLKSIRFNNTNLRKYKTILSEHRYKMNKSTIVQLDKSTYIPEDSLMDHIDTLTDNDLVKLLTMANLLRKRTVSMKAKYSNIGNIITKDDNDYLIYQKDNSNVYGTMIKFMGRVEEDTEIDFNKDYNYFLDHSIYYKLLHKNTVIPSDEEVYVIDNLTNDIIESVSSKKKERKYTKKLERKN